MTEVVNGKPKRFIRAECFACDYVGPRHRYKPGDEPNSKSAFNKTNTDIRRHKAKHPDHAVSTFQDNFRPRSRS